MSEEERLYRDYIMHLCDWAIARLDRVLSTPEAIMALSDQAETNKRKGKRTSKIYDMLMVASVVAVLLLGLGMVALAVMGVATMVVQLGAGCGQ